MRSPILIIFILRGLKPRPLRPRMRCGRLSIPPFKEPRDLCRVGSIIFIFFLLTSSFADEPYTLEKIVVRPTNTDSFSGKALGKNYSVQTFTQEEIKQKNLNSLVDLLDYVSGVDLRYRSPSGIQGDLSLRGSTYEQVAVLIDGVKVIDPQTGHHNLDIPLTEFDVQRVEVIKEGMSSLYGAGAFAGSVNIITQKPTKKALNLDTLFGENALFGQAMSFSFPEEEFSGRISFEHKVSKAARPNTDFEYRTASLYLNREWDSLYSDLLFGYQKKDFGADSFYSSRFPEEEEHTETLFARTGLDPKIDVGSLKNNLYFRKHRDKFILRRNNPTSVNYHTTYLYGMDSSLELPSKYGNFSFGLDTGQDEIFSTNLGKHKRFHEAGLLGFTPVLNDRLSADFRTRIDYYQNWPWQESWNVGIGYKINDKLKFNSSLGRAFRTPSFTDLYYSDPDNKGNPNLKVEKCDTFRLGLDLEEDLVSLKLDGFYRRGKNLIDWTRTSTADPWQATNLGTVDFKGIELISELRLGFNYKGLGLEKIIFSYNYTDADKKAAGFFSKYALDILKHQYLLDIYSRIFGIEFSWQMSYNQRYYGETYFIGNLSIIKKLKYKDFILEPFIKIDNFNNTKYTEVAGVIQPRRWIKAGVKFAW